MSRRRLDYVFVDDVNYLEPLLIEILVRASTKLEHMQYHRGSVVYPKEEIHSLLKINQLPSTLNEIERRKITKKLHAFSKEEEVHPITRVEEHHFTVVIKEVIVNKLKSSISNKNKTHTRNDSNKFNRMIYKLK